MDLILFDLDGTLYSSRNILPKAYEDGITEFNQTTDSSTVQVPSDKEIFDQVGKPVEEIYGTLFPELDFSAVERLRRAIVSNLLRLIREKEGRLYEGIPEVLDQLRTNRLMGLVTNAETPYMKAVLESHNLDRYFEICLCYDDAPNGKKSELVRMVLNKFDTIPQRTLLFGDRSSDLNAARTNETQFVGCEYGYGKPDGFNSVRSIGHPQEIPLVVSDQVPGMDVN